jgi:exosortase A-associated hydrolase 2
VAAEVFYLPVGHLGGSQRFCAFHAARGSSPKGALVYVHPFAEEMNKSRRMAAVQSRTFAENGYAILQIDLLGCGDSSGDFGDATWEEWVDDVVRASRWLRSRSAGALWLWGLRSGCLLATEAASRLDEPSRLLFWQPALSGTAVLRQFLRVQWAGEMLSGQTAGGVDSLRQRLEAGETIEVAGYRVSAALAKGLVAADLEPGRDVTGVEWLEVSPNEDRTLNPASSRAVARCRAAGCQVETRVVGGPSFWQTSEIEEAPELIAASLGAVGRSVTSA